MGVEVINSLADFRTIIGSDTPVIIDFWATWCGPCKTMSPVLDKISKVTPGVKFYKVDVDEQSEIAQEVGIRAMPTFILFKNGEKVDSLTGAYLSQLEKLVAKASD